MALPRRSLPAFRGTQTTDHEPTTPECGAATSPLHHMPCRSADSRAISPNEPRIALNRHAETAHPRQAEHTIDALERLRRRVLVVTTLGYIGCFAVWTIFAIIGVEIQRQYGLSDTEFGLLVGAPFLSGSLMRVVLGLWADRHGGRRLFFGVMVVAAVAT